MSYFPLFFNMKDRRVLVTGAGKVAQRRIAALAGSGAVITVVSREIPDSAGKLFQELSAAGVLSLYKMDYRVYRERFRKTERCAGEDRKDFFLVLAATGDREADLMAAGDGREAGAFVNVAGMKEMSDFYFPGIATQGTVVAGITAGGYDHHLAKHMTEAVQKCLTAELTGKNIDRRNRVVRIGSRESALAVVQSELVIKEIKRVCPGVETELVTMKTTGDMILDKSLEAIGGKGLFVKELDRALLEGRCDLTIHSLKDLPMEVPEQLPILAYSKREDKRDVLVLRQGLKELPANPVIGTFSRRRRLQASRLYPDAEFKGVRGNIITRLKKLDSGEYDALILAAAGLLRMGFEERVSRYFSVEEIIPSAGQGIMAVQGRSGEKLDFLDKIDDPDSRAMALAERAFVRTLDGGCSSPTAACAKVKEGKVLLRGLYYDEESDRCLTGEAQGSVSEAEKLGIQLAISLYGKVHPEGKEINLKLEESGVLEENGKHTV